jgi:hypothetical protein
MPGQARARSNRPRHDPAWPICTARLWEIFEKQGFRKVNEAPFHFSDHGYGAFNTIGPGRASWKSRWSEGRSIHIRNGAYAG